jgi:hypothetical protein
MAHLVDADAVDRAVPGPPMPRGALEQRAGPAGVPSAVQVQLALTLAVVPDILVSLYKWEGVPSN